MRVRLIIITVIALIALMSMPVFAQIDPTGEWAPRFHEDQPERLAGPEIGDYLGLPINDAARLRGDSWDASLLTLPEHQCKPHPADYGPRGPANIRRAALKASKFPSLSMIRGPSTEDMSRDIRTPTRKGTFRIPT